VALRVTGRGSTAANVSNPSITHFDHSTNVEEAQARRLPTFSVQWPGSVSTAEHSKCVVVQLMMLVCCVNATDRDVKSRTSFQMLCLPEL
jgi:hypothetical protein